MNRKVPKFALIAVIASLLLVTSGCAPWSNDKTKVSEMKPQKDAEAKIEAMEGEVAAAKKAADTAKAEALVQIKEAEDKIKALEGKVFVATEAAAKAEQARKEAETKFKASEEKQAPKTPADTKPAPK